MMYLTWHMLLDCQRARGLLLCFCDVLSIACMQADGSDSTIALHCMVVFSALAQIPTFRKAWVYKAKRASKHRQNIIYFVQS